MPEFFGPGRRHHRWTGVLRDSGRLESGCWDMARIESPLIGSGSQEEVDLRVQALLGSGHLARISHLRGTQRTPAGRSCFARQARFASDDDRRDGHQAHRRNRRRRISAEGRRAIKFEKPKRSREDRQADQAGQKRQAAKADDEAVEEDEERSDRSESRSRAGRGFHQAHRRSGADVSDADGRNPPAHPRAGNRPGQENRNHPQDFPLQGAGERLLPSVGRGNSPAGGRRRSAVRPHDEDQHRRRAWPTRARSASAFR